MKRYLLASDFDQTLSFNDSGIVLSELLGISDFREKTAGLSRIHLVQQGAELAYLLLHDPEYRRVRKEHLVEVGKRHYPYLPVDWMLRHRFDSIGRAPKIAVPLLCLVAADDQIIPAEHSRRLYAAWGGPKQWVELQGAGHNSTDSAPAFWENIWKFLTR